MFSCPKCGNGQGPKDEYCASCGTRLADKKVKVAVLLVPFSPCDDMSGYAGRWRLVWPARDLDTISLKTMNELRRHHSQGVVVWFEPALMSGMVIQADSWTKCDLYEDDWPTALGGHFVLVSLEPIENL